MDEKKNMSSTEANGSVDVGCFVPFYSFANITLLFDKKKNITLLFETQIDCSRVQSYYFDIEIVSNL